MNVFEVIISARSLAELRELDRFNLDLKHNVSVQKERDRFVIPGILSSKDIETVEAAGYQVAVIADLSKVAEERKRDLSTTNRFLEFRGVAEMAAASIEGYMTVDEVEHALENLCNQHSDVSELFELPNKTWEQRISHAVRLGSGQASPGKGVLITGGVHAREWGGSDICLAFAMSLVNAYKASSSVQYGGKVFSAAQIKTIMDRLNIFVFPDVNPDGKHYSQTSDMWWRKNRNPNTNVDPQHPGVDLNRNFDLLWDSGIGTSSQPQSNIYKGTAPFSEPETKNVRHCFDSWPNISYYVDIHSYGGLVLYSWGHENNQTTDPDQNFLNPAYDGQRANPAYTYREFIAPVDEIVALGLANRMNGTLEEVRGRRYKVQQGVALYPTSATSSDSMYGRHQADPTKPEVVGFTIEFGDEFIPPFVEMRKIIQDVSAALTELCWNVAVT